MVSTIGRYRHEVDAANNRIREAFGKEALAKLINLRPGDLLAGSLSE